MKWHQYILHSESSLLKSLTKRLNALKMISKVASFKTRLMVENGIFCSKVLYCLPLFGGTEEFVLNSLQVIQNEAARVVTKLDRFTSSLQLLRQTGWLSVRQLVFLYSVLLVVKVQTSKKPAYLAECLKSDYKYNTRISRQNLIQWGPEFRAKKTLTHCSWRWYGAANFNRIPQDLRRISDLRIFKTKLIPWIKDNIHL